MNWVEKTWNYLWNIDTVEDEPEVPRHEWVLAEDLFGSKCFGKRVEVPVCDDYYGQTNVVGRIVTMSYDSFNKRTTLEIQGPHFTATVDVYPEMQIMVHL